jgi:5-hydroxyisourate hydrolase-like protein (transthyretin family)
MKQAEQFNLRAVRAAWAIIALGALAFMFSLVGAEESALPSLGIHIVAPKSFLSDSTGAVSIIATDHAHNQPAAGATVTVRLASADGKTGTQLVRGKTDNRGTLDARFKIPALEPGNYSMHVEATFGRSHDAVDEDVQIRKAYKLLLVTDKPLYQPSQSIHMRALIPASLRSATARATRSSSARSRPTTSARPGPTSTSPMRSTWATTSARPPSPTPTPPRPSR